MRLGLLLPGCPQSLRTPSGPVRCFGSKWRRWLGVKRGSHRSLRKRGAEAGLLPTLRPQMGVLALLLCGVSLALPLTIADVCEVSGMKNEIKAADQAFALNCIKPPKIKRASVTWFHPSNGQISKDVHHRIHQEQTWILFLPLKLEDTGIYQCIIKNANSCYRTPVNLTVFMKSWCAPSRTTPENLSDDYQQILYLGLSGSLTCFLNFPNSLRLASIKWYKGCDEIESRGKRFEARERRLYVNPVSEEDNGTYACRASLNHNGTQYTVLNSISVDIAERIGNGGRIPKIIYPKNHSIEVELGSRLIVDCNITDVKENTNLRCWKVNNSLVDDYYNDSKRIREGVETNVSFPDHYFYTVNITFQEVKMEDYGVPFMCHAGVSVAYVVLRLPAPDFQAYLIGGLVTLAILVVSLLLIYNSFKIDLVLWYRSAFYSPGALADRKLYDAYVLYPKPQRESESHDVDTLVLTFLPEVLEQQCGYKLFIFGRDEFPGQAVANVIDENIKLCRRLMVILAAESLSLGLSKSWSEEQIAVYNALIQDGMKVILIELGTIEDYSAMPESIQYIRQKHGAIRWRGDFAERSPCAKTKFWKEVRYHMPPRRYPPSSPGHRGGGPGLAAQ
ncbi:interleukin-1 receptor-like 2 [Perognathus longimembris pacificus]|uniref:interleukin-1 receptor-like 2 n=1 Tax=Perognathus longimembris pacificus TaxID=214514 RepID=UPI00201870D2|nr:interleukin-1 receptor-like 2 [Perognathus longimembris pacificus]